MQERIAVIGLGYVGLPVALAFARKFPGAIGFDVNKEKVDELRRGFDRNQEVPEAELKASPLSITSDIADLAGVTFFVVAVPTPVDHNNVPDLTPVVRASETVGKALGKGAVVVFESTVYPGVTEEVCGPILAKVSGLTQGKDFTLGYSPERINPGDKEHTLIENTQRDLNIALMNELAIIFERMNIRTLDVLEAAGTKWNFLKFRPGLVGGHCIGVDPYYLTMKAQQLGYQPEVILAGRRINNNVGPYLAQRLVKMLINQGLPVKGARVGVLGLTFKEDCNDLRNSKVPDILHELREFGIEALIHDTRGNPAEAKHEYGLTLSQLEDYRNLDGLVVAVSHKEYVQLGQPKLLAMVRDNGCFIDVKSIFSPTKMERGIQYWSL
jgi:UDP-N-acetyl-D-galactosamine dehydrogenase